MALRRVFVSSSARTLELLTAAPGAAFQYVASERGAPDSDDHSCFLVDYEAEPDCVCGACPPRASALRSSCRLTRTHVAADSMKLRLLSLRPPGRLSLRSVVIEAVPAMVAPPAPPMAALMSAMQAGGVAQPGAGALLGMLGALAGGTRPAVAQPPAEVAAAAARVAALELALGEAGSGVGPQAEPLAALEQRISALEQRVESGLAALAERVARLEQGTAAAEHPP